MNYSLTRFTTLILRSFVVLFFVLLLLQPQFTSHAAGGTITSLTASVSGDVVTVNATVQALVALALGNLYIDIRTPSGTVIGTGSASVPILLLGQTSSSSTPITVSGWPENGNYTITACWSLGLILLDCAITSRSTTFFHVPTFGPELTFVAALLLGGYFWYTHKRLRLLRDVSP